LNLQLRSYDEKFENASDETFMGLLELNVKHDPCLARHIAKQGDPGSGYFSFAQKAGVKSTSI